MTSQWKAYCYECLGGGKDLTPPTTRKAANIEAASHATLYAHRVSVVEVED